MAIGRGYCLPEVSMTAQRRSIHGCTTILLIIVLVMLMMVGTRRVTMQTPENVSILHRVFSAVSPVLDGHYAPVMIPGDRGESPISPAISHKLTHWVRSLNHQGPWMVMLPQSYQLEKSRVRHTSQFGGRVPVPNAGPRRLTPTWREMRLEEIRAKLQHSPIWGSYQLVDYHEALGYIDLLSCDNVIVYSVHPANSTKVDAEFLRHAFEWDASLPLESAAPQCIMNLFPYESSLPAAERYEAVLRTMHLQLSGTIKVSAPKKTVPWIISPGKGITFTGQGLPAQSIIQKFIQATSNDLPQSAGIRSLSSNEKRAGPLSKIVDWIWGPVMSEASTTVPASESLDLDQLPFEEEPGLQTIEALICNNNTVNLSCNGGTDAPQMHRLAYMVGTRSACHHRFGPHVSSAMQIFRPSSLAALIAGTMMEILSQHDKEFNESILLSKVLMSMTGFRSSDFTKICKAQLDGYSGRRRWYDACRNHRRLISARTVDPKRFSGNDNTTLVFDQDGDLDGGHVYVHEAEVDFTRMQNLALSSIRAQADLWLLPAAESAFRFFNGHVSSGDWILEGPDTVAYACGRWLFGSGCETDIDSPGVVAESAAWTCGDIAVGFPSCTTADYFKLPFRAQVLNRSCNLDLPWLTDNEGKAFSLAKFADDIRGENTESFEEKIQEIVPNKHLQDELDHQTESNAADPTGTSEQG